MSKEMKYVMVDYCYPILFSGAQQHSEFKHFKVTSAGFCRIYDENDVFMVRVYGESISLNLSSDENDKARIENILNNY